MNNTNEQFVTRKADKSSVFVVLNREDYENSIRNLLANTEKLSKVEKYPTDDLKRELNKLVKKANLNTKEKLPKLEG